MPRRSPWPMIRHAARVGYSTRHVRDDAAQAAVRDRIADRTRHPVAGLDADQVQAGREALEHALASAAFRQRIIDRVGVPVEDVRLVFSRAGSQRRDLIALKHQVEDAFARIDGMARAYSHRGDGVTIPAVLGIYELNARTFREAVRRSQARNGKA